MEENQKKENFRKKAELLLHHLKPAASAFALGIGASLAATLLRTLFTQIIRFTVDHALLGETDGLPAFLLDAPAGRILVWCAAAAATVALLEFGAGFVQDSNLPKGSERFVKSLRDALYGHIQRLPYSWHVQNPTGDIIQRCTSDVEVVRNFIAEQMVELLSTTFLIAVYMIAMFAMNVKISLFVFAFIPVIVGYSLVFYKRISKGYQKADEAEGELSSAVQENITGVRVVRAFGRERDELEKFQRKNNNYANIWMKLGDMMTVFWSLGDVMSMAQVFGVVAIGVHLCVKGEITLGTYLAFVSYTRQLTWPVRALGRTLSEMSKAGVSIDRLLYILGAEQEQSPAKPLAANLSGDICFDHVSFAYEQKKVLRDVSFTVKGGTTLGVLGETGSGKSTIALLLSRLYDPGEGTITIGGVNVRRLPQTGLRAMLGYVPQKGVLFTGDILSNLEFAGDVSEADAIRAAATAQAEDFIWSRPHHFLTPVAQGGANVSGGQRQRLSIARAIAKHPQVYLFDDSFSALDYQTDAALRQALAKQTHDATVIIVAQRLSTILHADQILVLDGGRIVGCGTHSTLLRSCETYREIALSQLSAAELGEEG